MKIKRKVEFMVTPYHQHAVNRQISYSEKYEIASVKHKLVIKYLTITLKAKVPYLRSCAGV